MIFSSAQIIFIPNTLKYVFWKNQPRYINKIRLMTSILCNQNSMLKDKLEKDSIILLGCELDHLGKD